VCASVARGQRACVHFHALLCPSVAGALLLVLFWFASVVSIEKIGWMSISCCGFEVSFLLFFCLQGALCFRAFFLLLSCYVSSLACVIFRSEALSLGFCGELPRELFVCSCVCVCVCLYVCKGMSSPSLFPARTPQGLHTATHPRHTTKTPLDTTLPKLHAALLSWRGFRWRQTRSRPRCAFSSAL
jgi:hypothetical protein